MQQAVGRQPVQISQIPFLCLLKWPGKKPDLRHWKRLHPGLHVLAGKHDGVAKGRIDREHGWTQRLGSNWWRFLSEECMGNDAGCGGGCRELASTQPSRTLFHGDLQIEIALY